MYEDYNGEWDLGTGKEFVPSKDYSLQEKLAPGIENRFVSFLAIRSWNEKKQENKYPRRNIDKIRAWLLKTTK